MIQLIGFVIGASGMAGAIEVRRNVLGWPRQPPADVARPVSAENSLAIEPFSEECRRLLGEEWQVVGRAVGGQTTGRMIADAGEIDRSIVAGKRIVLLIWEGGNELNDGATPDHARDRRIADCKARREARWEMIVLKLLTRVSPGLPPRVRIVTTQGE